MALDVFSNYQFTPGAKRALDAALQWSEEDGAPLELPALLMGLLVERECRAAVLLSQAGVCEDQIHQRWPQLRKSSSPEISASGDLSLQFQASLAVAGQFLRAGAVPEGLATEHLLYGILSIDNEVSQWLHDAGLTSHDVESVILRVYGSATAAQRRDLEDTDLPPLAIPDECRHTQIAVHTDVGEPSRTGTQSDNGSIGDGIDTVSQSSASCVSSILSDRQKASPLAESVRQQSPEFKTQFTCHTTSTEALRALDAAANRAEEGLRVVEDFARFGLDDRHLTARLKSLRHEISAELSRIERSDLLAARETQNDVGTTLSESREEIRNSVAGLVTANFKRAEQALRSLEEYSKLLDPTAAAALKTIRYGVYTLEKAVMATVYSSQKLRQVRLYVLVDGASDETQFSQRVNELIAGGVHAIQLRDKSLPDHDLLARARILRSLTTGTGVLCIINDRPDVASLVHADGVHVGQEELTVSEVRRVMGTHGFVGVSTHSLEQAKVAVLAGADYIGVGPVYPSTTKAFKELAGLSLLTEVAADIQLPAFAIGGINRENVSQVLAAGACRIAVAGAVWNSADPACAVGELLSALEGRFAASSSS